MSSSTPRTTRQKRATSHNIHQNLSNPNESNSTEDFAAFLHSSSQFIELYNRSTQSRSILIVQLCQILSNSSTNNNIEIDRKIPIFILECLTNQSECLTENVFKENLLTFFKQIFTRPDDDELVLATFRCFSHLIQHRSTILLTTLAEWLSSIFHFLVTFLSASTYVVYDHLLNDLLGQIVQHFSPLSKDLVDVLSRTSSTIISTNFLQQLKLWIDHTDDLRFALFALQLWQTLAKLFTRLIMKNHSKAVQIFSVVDDAFICSNNAVQSAAFTVWSSFISHFHQIDEFDCQTNSNSRLFKLFLTPFLSDSTSKSKTASISKCHAWLTLISFYPKHFDDVVFPFLNFAFGNEISTKTSSTTVWWSECRQIAGEFLENFLLDASNAENSIRIGAENFFKFVFDLIFEKFFETNVSTDGKSSWLNIWNSFVKNLMNVFHSTNSIDEKQRQTLNMCLFTRIEQWWIDSRVETRFLLNLFETFEQIGFPLAIETVPRDPHVRTKTLSATQNFSSTSKNFDEKMSNCRTTLSDQFLHMMLEHAVRFNDDDVNIEENYLRIVSFLIESLAKTSDEIFSQQATSLLTKCSVELNVQPMTIPTLFWHIWFRCSTHLIQILNRTQTFELNNRSDNAKQDAALELLLRPFDFNDISRLDYSYTTLWIQLFKALVRLALLDSDQSKTILVHLLTELLRNKPAFEQAIHDERNQRLFGWILVILKTLIKTLSEHEFFNFNADRSNLFSMSQKRSIPSSIQLCLTQLALILNDVIQRILTNNENNLQYLLVASCLVKSNKCSAMDQAKSMIFTSIRDLLVDLFGLCKIYSHFEILMKNLTELLPFLNQFEQSANPSSSPVSQQKQTADQLLLNKILLTITTVFEPTYSSSLLQLSSTLLILAFQHPKTLMRNKTRKYWNETFGRCTFLIYPNELRACLRELKDKEHLLLPCFLADHDNSNTAGSGTAPPASTDESQLSQQIDIVTPLIRPALPTAQRLTFSSPTRATSPAKTLATRTTTNNHDEPVFVPITNNINFNNQMNSPLTGNKRRTSAANSCLTEKQKEKLRSRQMIPLLCDDHSNTQSSICTMDAPSSDGQSDPSNIEKKSTSSALPLFSQPAIEKTAQPVENPNEEENVPEESSIAKKLRRSCRPSISARKSLVNKIHKTPAIPMIEELAVITTSPMEMSPTSSSSSTSAADGQAESTKYPIKGILKRLSPTKPRATHKRHVVFHDQVKVLVFASPSRRDLLLQQKKKSPNKDEVKSSPKVVPRENLPLRKQPMSARRLSAMPSIDSIPVLITPPPPPSPLVNNAIKSRSSKLFHPKDALADWTETQSTIESIYPNLIDCDKPLETLVPFLFENETLANEFRQCPLKTIGDLARCTIEQIHSFSLPTPKLSNLQKILSTYENQLEKTSTKILTIDNNDDLSPPIATTSDEDIVRCSTDFTGQSQTAVTSSNGPLYDVDVLMASLDYENRSPSSAGPTKTETNSPRKRCLMPINNVETKIDDEQNSSSPKKANLSETTSQTLGDRLKAAVEVIQIKGYLPFDDDYVELVRQLVNNPSLTHLEKNHLKKSFLNH